MDWTNIAQAFDYLQVWQLQKLLWKNKELKQEGETYNRQRI